MRLLLDQNLSVRLLTVLGDLYPGWTHVRKVGLQAADDDTVASTLSPAPRYFVNVPGYIKWDFSAVYINLLIY